MFEQDQSVQSLSHVRLFATPWTAACQASLSITNTQLCLNSCPSSQWSHSTVSSSVVPFSSCLQSFLASGSFPMSQFFPSCGKSIGVLALASVQFSHSVVSDSFRSYESQVLLMNLQDLFPLGLIGWLSMQSKGLSRVFSNTIVQKNQFLGTQLSLQSNPHIHTWLSEKP